MENLTLLIEKSRAGDRDAFARIVEKYQGMVSAVTLNIVGDYAQSEDLAQETFLTAWTKLPELRDPEKSASWLYGIARRVALHWRERQERNPLRGAAELDERTMTGRDDPSESERLARREQSIRLIWSTVAELPETLREPLLLYYRYSKSVAEIAESMQLTEETVRQRLSRGRKRLKTGVLRQVETVLESTGPDTAFTLAVLAAIPLAATTSGCAATSKSIGLLSGGAARGGPWIVLAVLTCLALLLFSSTTMILLAIVTFYALRHAIKKSPTVRTRRFVIGAALDFNLLLWIYYFFKRCILNGLVLGHWGPGINSVTWFSALPEEVRDFLFGGLPIFLIFSAFMLHVVLRWQELLYEDSGGKSPVKEDEPEPEPSVWAQVFENEKDLLVRLVRKIRWGRTYFLSAKGIRKKRNVYMILAFLCLFLYVAQGIRQIVIMLPHFHHYSNTFLAWLWGSTAWFYLLQIAFQLVFFRVIDAGIRISENRTSFDDSGIGLHAPAERKQWLRTSLVLLSAIPLATMLLAVGLGVVRHAYRSGAAGLIQTLPGNHIFQIVQVEIVLVVLAALWASRNPRKRFAIVSGLFFVTGLTTFLFVEWAPLADGFLAPHLNDWIFWWLPETDTHSISKGRAWKESNPFEYFYWHVFAVTWLVYSLAVSISLTLRRLWSVKE